MGSSQNVSLVNTVLNTITAEAFKNFSDAIEAGASPREVASKALDAHWRVIFNGDNYDEANQQMLTDMGLWRIDSGVEAMQCFTSEKNVKLFSELGVLSPEESASRQAVLLAHYSGTVEMEALCMIDMINKNVLPSMREADLGFVSELESAVGTLKSALAAIHAETSEEKAATMARTLRLETMEEVRAICDAAEAVCPEELWTLATYKDLLFLDQTLE